MKISFVKKMFCIKEKSLNLTITVNEPHLHVSRDGHEDLLAIGRDTVKQRRVVKGTVPGSLKAEHAAVISQNLS